jgi:hypothetical protein
MVMNGGMSGLGAIASGGSVGDDSEATLRQTVSTALSNAAKTAMEQLQSHKK